MYSAHRKAFLNEHNLKYIQGRMAFPHPQTSLVHRLVKINVIPNKSMHIKMQSLDKLCKGKGNPNKEYNV